MSFGIIFRVFKDFYNGAREGCDVIKQNLEFKMRRFPFSLHKYHQMHKVSQLFFFVRRPQLVIIVIFEAQQSRGHGNSNREVTETNSGNSQTNLPNT